MIQLTNTDELTLLAAARAGGQDAFSTWSTATAANCSSTATESSAPLRTPKTSCRRLCCGRGDD